MGKRQVRISGPELSLQLSLCKGKAVQLVLEAGRTIRVNVLDISADTLTVADFTQKRKKIPFARVVELVIDQEAPY